MNSLNRELMELLKKEF